MAAAMSASENAAVQQAWQSFMSRQQPGATQAPGTRTPALPTQEELHILVPGGWGVAVLSQLRNQLLHDVRRCILPEFQQRLSALCQTCSSQEGSCWEADRERTEGRASLDATSSCQVLTETLQGLWDQVNHHQQLLTTLGQQLTQPPPGRTVTAAAKPSALTPSLTAATAAWSSPLSVDIMDTGPLADQETDLPPTTTTTSNHPATDSPVTSFTFPSQQTLQQQQQLPAMAAAAGMTTTPSPQQQPGDQHTPAAQQQRPPPYTDASHAAGMLPGGVGAVCPLVVEGQLAGYRAGVAAMLADMLPGVLCAVFSRVMSDMSDGSDVLPGEDQEQEVDDVSNHQPTQPSACLAMVSRAVSLLSHLGLSHVTHRAVTRCMDESVRRQCATYAEDLDRQILPAIGRFLDGTLLAFIRAVLDGEATTRNGPTTTGAAALQRWRRQVSHLCYEVVCERRCDQVFEIVVDYPDSLPAVHDLAECLAHTNMRSHFLSCCRASLSRRLLHPGASAPDIVHTYVSTIRVLQALDQDGSLLAHVTGPVRAYLRTRPDTVRCVMERVTGAPGLRAPRVLAVQGPGDVLQGWQVVSQPAGRDEEGEEEGAGPSLLEEAQQEELDRPTPPTNLTDEDAVIALLEEQQRMETDAETASLQLPGSSPSSALTAAAAGRRRASAGHSSVGCGGAGGGGAARQAQGPRGSDVVQLLLQVFENRDHFVAEYRACLSLQLLRLLDPDLPRALRTVELLKIRFGETALHACEVMLKDMADSRRINTACHNLMKQNYQKQLTAAQQQQPPPPPPAPLQPFAPAQHSTPPRHPAHHPAHYPHQQTHQQHMVPFLHLPAATGNHPNHPAIPDNSGGEDGYESPSTPTDQPTMQPLFSPGHNHPATNTMRRTPQFGVAGAAARAAAHAAYAAASPSRQPAAAAAAAPSSQAPAATCAAHQSQPADQPPQPPCWLSATVTSHLFWPPMGGWGDDLHAKGAVRPVAVSDTEAEAKLVLPPAVSEALEAYGRAFQELKAPRQLRWKPHLGMAELEVRVGEVCFLAHVSPVTASLLMAFQSERGSERAPVWTLQQLSDKVGLSVSLVRRRLLFWLETGVVVEETAQQPNADDQGGAALCSSSTTTTPPAPAPARYTRAAQLNPAMHGAFVTDATVPDELALGGGAGAGNGVEAMAVYEPYLMGVLLNTGGLTLDRLQTMLKRFVVSPKYEASQEQLASFLQLLVAQDKVVVAAGGVYRRKASSGGAGGGGGAGAAGQSNENRA